MDNVLFILWQGDNVFVVLFHFYKFPIKFLHFIDGKVLLDQTNHIVLSHFSHNLNSGRQVH